MTTSDRWHIGSDTKAFTATLIARLVEQGVMRFDDTLAASFPAFAEAMDPAYRNVTVTQLLSHTAGLPPLTDDKDLPAFMAVIKSANGVKAQREAIARKYLTMPPASKAGDFAYSNLGFIIVGAIAEARTGKSWEDLIREQIFTPLGIKSAGFGPPGTPGKLDQPWGHKDEAGKLVALDPAQRRRRQSAGARSRRYDQYRAEGLAALCPGPTRRRARPRQTSETGNLSQTAHAGDGELRARLGREA